MPLYPTNFTPEPIEFDETLFRVIKVSEIEKKVGKAGKPLHFYFFLRDNKGNKKLYKALCADDMSSYYDLEDMEVFYELIE